jgi:hypothetical protein
VVDNSKKELIIIGEWMTPRIFSFKANKFIEIKNNLDNLYGWWQTVATADINNDGKQDLLLGNIGENFYLNPDNSNPAKLWINDYDQNNSIEKIMTYTIEGKDMPVFLKKDMEEQLPSIKKSNLKNEVYAVKSIQDLFPRNILNKSVIKKFNYTSSCAAINNGNGNFTIQKLPIMTQLSCINVFYPIDLNNDGYIDLVTGGNQFGFLPQFERLDASTGDVLINDKKGGFIWQETAKTGINLRGEMRDIAGIKSNDNTYLLFLQNNEYPLMYRMNQLK